MAHSPTHTARQIAAACGGRLVDDARTGDVTIRRVATVDDASADAVTWITTDVFAKRMGESGAGLIIAKADHLADEPRGLVVADPDAAIAKVLQLFRPPSDPLPAGIHPTAIIDASAQVAADVGVGPFAVIGAETVIGAGTRLAERVSIGRAVRVGRDCTLHANAVVYDRCELGDRVTLHAGAVIGKEGFGFYFRDGAHRRFPQIGTVVIGDDVEIGVHCCVDRAKLGETRIGPGTKIDNLVQVAHNCQMGPLCMVIAQVGLAGSTRLGAGVMMGGHSGCIPSVRMGDGARLGVNSVAWSDVPAGQTYSGNPARPHAEELREKAGVRRLPKMMQQVQDLVRRVAELEASADHRKAR